MRKKGHKKFFIFIFFLISSVLILLSPLFNIKHIEVSEVSVYDKDDISETLNSAIGENGFIYLLKNAKGFESLDYLFMLRAFLVENELVFHMPYLKDVNIKFQLPDTLDVTFDVRKPAFLIEMFGTYICSDSEGVIVDSYTESDKIDLPIVVGIELIEYKIGNRIASSDDEKIETIKELFHWIEKIDENNEGFNLSTNIDIIDISEYNDIWLFIGENFKIRLGDKEDLETNLTALKEICIVEKERIESNVMNGTLDFTAGSNPIFIPA